MPQATQQAQTIGEQFRSGDALSEGVNTIIADMKTRQAEINAVRGPIDGAKETLDSYLKKAESSRGKGLIFPYLGSGLGNGPFVEMVDGSVKLDLTCGIGPHFFGHSDPELVETALHAATSDVAMQGYFQQNSDAIDFTDTLVKEAGRRSNLAHAFLSNSGAMANDNALKMAYHHNAPADRVIAFKDCFMGRSVAMCQIGDSAGNRVGVPTTIPIDYMPFFDATAAARMSAGDVSGQTRWIDMSVWHLQQYIDRYPGKHAAFVFEVIQGEGGYNTAPREYFTALMDVCKANGIAVWIDEIQTFGRTLEMFAFEAHDLGEYVDLCTVGKMTQICAALFTPDYNPKPCLLSGTFLGNTVGLNVGRRMIERLRAGDYYGENGRIARHHRLFIEQVKSLSQRHPEWFPENPRVQEFYGGNGGMMRFTPYGGEKDKILSLCRAMFDVGVVALYCGHDPYHVRLLPPLGVMSEDLWPTIFELIEKAMSKLASN